MIKTYLIQDREAGNVIDKHLSYDEAVKKVEYYETLDKIDENYTSDFYEIVEECEV